MRYFPMLILLVVGLVACSNSTRKETARRSSSVITAEEIEKTSASNAYEAIQILRPNLLHRQSGRYSSNATGQASMQAQVYVDDVRYGDFETLRQISTFNIAEIEYLSPSEATMRHGTGHAGGAFLIKSK